MPWFPVDDGFAFHRKTVKAGNAAIGLWVRAGSWAAQQTTDGHVPAEMAELLGTPVQARRLVAAGLWTEVEGGYQFHEWSAPGRNKTRKQIEADRAAAAARKQRERERAEKGGKQNARTVEAKSSRTSRGPSEENGLFPEEPQVSDTSHGDVTASSQGESRRESAPPIPSHPIPTEEHPPSEGVARKRASRATRIPDDFAVTPEMVAWVAQDAPDVDGRRETAKFVDYWRGKSGKDATKVDWPATWRNWIRRAQDDLRDTRPTGLGSSTPYGVRERPATGRGAKAAEWIELGREMNQQLTRPPLTAIDGGRTERQLS